MLSQEQQSGARRQKVSFFNLAASFTTLTYSISEDAKLGAELLASEKDRAEHIMLVDLARNDVNRVCQPKTVKVDHLMQLERFSHVIHLTSQVSGLLRQGLNRYEYHTVY